MALSLGATAVAPAATARPCAALSRKASAPAAAAARAAGRSRVVCSAESGDVSSRRGALRLGAAVLLGAASTAGAPRPALAGLFNGDEVLQEAYTEDTTAIIKLVQDNLALDRSDPSRAESIQAVRKATADWVAKYRREDRVQAKPSYSQTYTALNAVAGHYNSFGTKYPLPPKRLTRVNKELAFASKAIAAGK